MNEFIQISINLPNLLVSISKESEYIKANLRFVLLQLIIDNPLLNIKKSNNYLLMIHIYISFFPHTKKDSIDWQCIALYLKQL